jgi:hypothetical protein
VDCGCEDLSEKIDNEIFLCRRTWSLDAANLYWFRSEELVRDWGISHEVRYYAIADGAFTGETMDWSVQHYEDAT